jgi:sugar phosphate isomerase/epimerase
VSFVKMGFAPLVGLKAAELRRKIEDAGLRVVSCHYQHAELRESIDERIAFARELGLKHMVIATMSVPRTAPLDDWKRAADEANRFGEKLARPACSSRFTITDSSSVRSRAC